MCRNFVEFLGVTRFPYHSKIALWKKALTGNKKGVCYGQESDRIEAIIQITLTDDEQKALKKSADAVKELVEVLKKLK
jgi:Trp operon repressor